MEEQIKQFKEIMNYLITVSAELNARVCALEKVLIDKDITTRETLDADKTVFMKEFANAIKAQTADKSEQK